MVHEVILQVDKEEEIVFEQGTPLVSSAYVVGSYYASENGDDDPAVILGLGTWRRIPPANTVNELKNLSGDYDFVTIGTLYVWDRLT